MLSLLLPLALLTQDHSQDRLQTVLNSEATGPAQSHDKLSELATSLGRALYVPDETARAYTLTQIETTSLSKNEKFPGLGKRTATRLTYTNERTGASFDVFQVPSTEGTNPASHTKWVASSGHFELSLTKFHTTVSQKFGLNDVMLTATLISEPSAKILLSKFVRIAP